MTFSYPYNSPTVTVTFTHGIRPDNLGREYEQVVRKTPAAVRIAQYYRAKIRTIPLTWDNMPLADKTALESFFNLYAVGMANLFKLTLPDGTVKQVRFAEPSLRFVEKSTDVYGITVLLLEA